jgi:hypothetical protein
VTCNSLAVWVKLPVLASEEKALNCLLSSGGFNYEFLSWLSCMFYLATMMPISPIGTRRAK